MTWTYFKNLSATSVTSDLVPATSNVFWPLYMKLCNHIKQLLTFLHEIVQPHHTAFTFLTWNHSTIQTPNQVIIFLQAKKYCSFRVYSLTHTYQYDQVQCAFSMLIISSRISVCSTISNASSNGKISLQEIIQKQHQTTFNWTGIKIGC